jgi:hypothetical protein
MSRLAALSKRGSSGFQRALACSRDPIAFMNFFDSSLVHNTGQSTSTIRAIWQVGRNSSPCVSGVQEDFGIAALRNFIATSFNS